MSLAKVERRAEERDKTETVPYWFTRWLKNVSSCVESVAFSEKEARLYVTLSSGNVPFEQIFILKNTLGDFMFALADLDFQGGRPILVFDLLE